MTKVLILGANGQLARNTTKAFLADTDAELTLYLRRASRLENPSPGRVTVVEGDVNDVARLRTAMSGQDIVFASLTGDMARQARSIIDAMDARGAEAADLRQFNGHLRRSAGRALPQRSRSL